MEDLKRNAGMESRLQVFISVDVICFLTSDSETCLNVLKLEPSFLLSDLSVEFSEVTILFLIFSIFSTKKLLKLLASCSGFSL